MFLKNTDDQRSKPAKLAILAMSGKLLKYRRVNKSDKDS